MAVPSEAALQALEKLSEDPKNLVYIISGRDSAFLEQHLGYLKNVGFSAEHGCFIREPGATKWTNLTESLDMSWMPEVEELFEYYTEVSHEPSIVDSLVTDQTLHREPPEALLR